MRLSVIAALAAASTFGVGCAGASSDPAANFNGASADVAKVIDRLADSAAKRDTRTICDDLLTKESVAAIRAKQNEQCDVALRKLFGSTTSRDVQAEKVTIDGDKATVVVKVPNVDGTSTMTLRKVGTTWRIVLPAN
jgi:hypothetical protein